MRRFVYGRPVVDWVAANMKRGDGYGPAAGIGIEEDGELIAGVVYHEYNKVNVLMHVASNGKKNWLSRDALWLFFDYPFNQLKVKRISAFIEDDNAAAITMDERLGFVYETRMVNAYENGDLLIYKMLRENCPWLNHQPKRRVIVERIGL